MNRRRRECLCVNLITESTGRNKSLDRRHAERESTPVALKPGATAMAPPSPQVLIMEFAAAIAFGLLLSIVKIPLFARLKIS
jgi:hypothetical protein